MQVADSPQGPSSVVAPDNGWSSVTRVAFGFFCGYALLVWLPWTLGVGLNWFFALGQWSITRVFQLPDHYVPSSTASNFLASYTATLLVSVFSGIAAVAWAVLDTRETTHRKVFPWLHTAVRYGLAYHMLVYGLSKVVPAQFGRFVAGGGTDYLIHQVGQLPPRDLLWAFMEASRSYQVFTGLVEVAGGLLLLPRSTAALGALVSTVALTNVVLLNVSYDVSVKFWAGQLLLMAAFVVAPYGRGLPAGLANYWRGTKRRDRIPRLFRNSRADVAARVIGVLVAIGLTASAYRAMQRVVVDNQSIPQTPLHGIWDVEEITRAGIPVPLVITDASLWRRLVLPWSGTNAGAIVVWMSDAVTRCNSSIDVDAKTIALGPFSAERTVTGSVRSAPQDLPPLEFTFELTGKDRLTLYGKTDGGEPLAIRLRLFESSRYPLIKHRPEWTW